MTIEQRHTQVRDWASQVLGGANVAIDPQGRSAGAAQVSLQLLEIIPDSQSRGIDRQTTLRYLATAVADRADDAWRLVGALVFAGMMSSDIEVETTSPTLELWRTLGTSPRPSFLFRCKASKETAPRFDSLASKVVLDVRVARPIVGFVLDSGGRGISGATVSLPTPRLSAVTDSSGRFVFPSVPSEANLGRLVIRSGERERHFDLARVPFADGTAVIHFDGEEPR